LSTSVTHSNFLGTGRRVSFDAQSSSFRKVFSVSHTQPYATINGVSRTESLQYSNVDQLGRDLEEVSTENLGLSIGFGMPIAEFTRVNFSVNPQKSELLASPGGTVQTLSFVTNPDNGELFETFRSLGLRFDALELSAGWLRDTRNRALFADRGATSAVRLTVAAPPGDLRYYTLNIDQRNFFPLGKGFTIGVNANVAFGKALGDTSDLPPFKKLFAGGPNSVRAFRDNFLAPRDEGQVTFDFGGATITRVADPANDSTLPVGGNFRTYVQTELFLPNFFSDDPLAPPKNGRFSVFLDIGNVFRDFDDFRSSDLRASAGIAGNFLTPIGAIRISFGVPIRHKENDDIEKFQFTVGTIF
ncbi:MAG: BamA/TamA family outer membrane protein, partial [Gammaproteobacteria bacterium]|nr:BamA/TamA family outer membrane protein [Gammaproteobacteria bacterium]